MKVHRVLLLSVIAVRYRIRFTWASHVLENAPLEVVVKKLIKGANVGVLDVIQFEVQTMYFFVITKRGDAVIFLNNPPLSVRIESIQAADHQRNGTYIRFDTNLKFFPHNLQIHPQSNNILHSRS